MVYLIDTNILLRIARRSDEHFPIVRKSIRELLAKGHQLHTTLQNFAEFWNVSTRPVFQNSMGLSLAETDDLLDELESMFTLIPDLPEVYPEWRDLIVNYSVSGVQVHDARLVATMIVHGVTHILTFNTSDFVRYSPTGIVAVDPAKI